MDGQLDYLLEGAIYDVGTLCISKYIKSMLDGIVTVGILYDLIDIGQKFLSYVSCTFTIILKLSHQILKDT